VSSACCRYLFVYGTLLSAVRRNRFARYLARNAVLLGPAAAPGRLYALPRFPALRPPQAPKDVVRGEVHRLFQPEAMLRILDDYEDRQYRRVIREATLEAGGTVRCWMYEWTSPLPEHRRIGSGRWIPPGAVLQ
jgi:gamma-glutamylcyclotransferase (GGCT)/AIG2-like uncharacterized protein YtfP